MHKGRFFIGVAYSRDMEQMIILSFIVLILAYGCVSAGEPQSGPGPLAPAGPEASPDPMDEGKAPSEAGTLSPAIEAVISSYDESDTSTFGAADLLLQEDPLSMLPLLSSEEPYHVWTGLYVLSNSAGGADEAGKARIRAAIQPHLGGDSPSYRFMSAVVLLAMEDMAGCDALVSSLEEDGLLMLSEPPRSICDYSHYMLVRYCSDDLGYPCLGDEDAMAAWQASIKEGSA